MLADGEYKYFFFLYTMDQGLVILEVGKLPLALNLYIIVII